MEPTDKALLVDRALHRAITGLYFLEDYMRDKSGGTDGAYSRSWYILLSYNFELILDSLVLFASEKNTRNELINELVSVRPTHDYEKLSKKVPDQLLLSVGIQSIKKESMNGFVQYRASLTNGRCVVVQDLVDVRYDFKKDSYRSIDPNEKDRIKVEITDLQEIIKKIQKSVADQSTIKGA